MASGRLIDYLGQGLASARPAAPDLYTGALGLWYSTDTGVLSVWDGTGWSDTGGLAVVAPSGGFSDGALLVYDSGAQAFIELPPGNPGDVLTATASNGPQWDPAGGGGGGDVNGPVASTDTAVPRWNGTGGTDLENTGVLIGDDDELSGYKALVDRATGTSWTPAETDSGKIKELSNAATITVTLPSTMPKGFACTVVQMGAGVVDFVPESGGSLVNRQGHNSSAGQYAICTLYVSENTTGAVWVLGGDTAT